MSLILLRHTRPDMPDGLCYGRTDLLPGADFADTAARIAGDLPLFARVYSSPLQRCHMLAEHVAAVRDRTVEPDDRLIEADFGSWENRAWNDIPRAELDLWAQDFMGARAHGGESVEMLRKRVALALAAVDTAAGPVLWVTHSGVIRAVCAILDRHNGWNTAVAFGEWLEIDLPP